MCFLSDELLEQLVSKHGYKLREQIGKGKYGWVYRITSLRYSEDFVLKYIPYRKTHSCIDQKMEEYVLQNLTHPNIISIYEVWEEMNGISLVTEYCPNGSYAEILHENGKLSLSEFTLVAK